MPVISTVTLMTQHLTSHGVQEDLVAVPYFIKRIPIGTIIEFICNYVLRPHPLQSAVDQNA